MRKDIQAKITGYSKNESGDRFIFYTIVVSTPKRVWTLYKRYSQFYDLHRKLLKTCPSNSRPKKAILPPKVKLSSMLLTPSHEELAKYRVNKLEKYILEILNSGNTTWADSPLFKEFLELKPEDYSTGNLLKEKNNDFNSLNAHKDWLRRSMNLALELTSIEEALINKTRLKFANTSFSTYLEITGYWDIEKRIKDASSRLESLTIEFELIQAKEQALIDVNVVNLTSYNLRYVKYVATINSLRNRLNSLIVLKNKLEQCNSIKLSHTIKRAFSQDRIKGKSLMLIM